MRISPTVESILEACGQPPDGIILKSFDRTYNHVTDHVEVAMRCATVLGIDLVRSVLTDPIIPATVSPSVDTTLIRQMYKQIEIEMHRRIAVRQGTNGSWPPYLYHLYAQAKFVSPQCDQDYADGLVAYPGMFYTKGEKMTPEGRIKGRLNKGLKSLNLVWKYMPVPSGYGMQSLDYLLCVAGHFVAIETKAPGKHPTPRQEATIACIKGAGGLVFVCDSDESVDACIGALVLLHRVGTT